MKKLVFSCLMAVGLAICLSGAPARAQGKVNVFAGYSFATNNDCAFGECEDPGIHGYSASVAYNFNRFLGIEGNFSGHNGTATTFNEPATNSDNGETEAVRENIYLYTFGPRMTLPVGNFSLFSHFLVGAAHSSSTFTDKCIPEIGEPTECSEFDSDRETSHGNGFAFKTGGGVDWNRRRWGIRILEVDYIHTDIYSTEIETCSECNSTPESFNSSGSTFELSTGVTFHFGMR